MQLRDHYPAILKKAQLFAISYEDLDTETKLKTELKLPYPLLSDSKYQAIDQYCGREGNNTYSKPAAYVIAPDGTIKWSYVGITPNDRPTMEVLMANI